MRICDAWRMDTAVKMRIMGNGVKRFNNFFFYAFVNFGDADLTTVAIALLCCAYSKVKFTIMVLSVVIDVIFTG